LVEIIAGAVLTMAIVYLTLFLIRVNTGLSKTLDVPSHVVRLQVVNASAEKAWLDRLVGSLSSCSEPDMEIQVVARDNFNTREVPHTMLVSRLENLRAAKLLAGKLGLNPALVFYKPLEHNRDYVTATLLIGRDYDKLDVAALLKKETIN